MSNTITPNKDQKIVLEALKETKEIKSLIQEMRNTLQDVDSTVIFKELMKLKRTNLN